jgi:hypothetical protein
LELPVGVTIALGLMVGLAGCGGEAGSEASGSAGQELVLEVDPDPVVVRIDVRSDAVESTTVDAPDEAPPEGLPAWDEVFVSFLDETHFVVYWFPAECQTRPHITLEGGSASLRLVLDPGPHVLNREISPPEECNAVGRLLRLSVATREPIAPEAITADVVRRDPGTGELLEDTPVRELELDAGQGVVVRVDIRAAVVESVTVDIPVPAPQGLEPGPNTQLMSLVDERHFEVYWWTLECQKRPHITVTAYGERLEAVLDPGAIAPDCGAAPPEGCVAGMVLRLTVSTSTPITRDLITWGMLDSPPMVACLEAGAFG